MANITLLDLPFVETISDKQSDAISGGAGSLIDVDVIHNDILKNVNVGVNANVLGNPGSLSNNFPLKQA